MLRLSRYCTEFHLLYHQNDVSRDLRWSCSTSYLESGAFVEAFLKRYIIRTAVIVSFQQSLARVVVFAAFVAHPNHNKIQKQQVLGKRSFGNHVTRKSDGTRVISL
jgi:hypothetical protein